MCRDGIHVFGIAVKRAGGSGGSGGYRLNGQDDGPIRLDRSRDRGEEGRLLYKEGGGRGILAEAHHAANAAIGRQKSEEHAAALAAAAATVAAVSVPH